MTRKTSLSFQIKRLLSSLSDHGTRHLTEIETDLIQTNFLLREAIEKLGKSFMAIHQTVSAQQEAVDALLSSAQATEEITDILKTRQREIAEHINAAVTGLQFQDMTSQLISRSMQRLTGLREALGNMGASGSAIPMESEVEEIMKALNKINTALEEQSTELENALWRAVCQTHMESGDIELF